MTAHQDLGHVTGPVRAALHTLLDELSKDAPPDVVAAARAALEGAWSQCEEAVRIVRRARL